MVPEPVFNNTDEPDDSWHCRIFILIIKLMGVKEIRSYLLHLLTLTKRSKMI